MIRKIYVDGPFGQIHLRLTARVPGVAPLVCLHATAYSSRTFVPLMQMATGRQVIAVDMPGYGESDAPPGPIDIPGYADAVAVAIAELPEAGPVALLGYHTGVYVATELAIRHPALVERLVLIGIPYFQALDLTAWREKLAARHMLVETLDQFDERWDFFITRRAATVSLQRGFENFVDELKGWPNGWWAHEAMFDYDSDTRLPLFAQPTLVLNAGGYLDVPSRIAAGLMQRAEVRDLPDVTGPVLDAAPDRILAEVEPFLALQSRVE